MLARHSSVSRFAYRHEANTFSFGLPFQISSPATLQTWKLDRSFASPLQQAALPRRSTVSLEIIKS